MTRSLVCCLSLILFGVRHLDGADAWSFTPGEDRFTDDALLDLRGLNEEQSGETGFVRLSDHGDDFVRGDGEPLRFWAVGSDLYRREPEEMDRHCRFLAKQGGNLVRLHATVAATNEGAGISDVNEQEIAGIFRFIQAAKENGIYLLISPYYGHHLVPESWKLEGWTGKNPWGAIFIEPQMQAAYRAWMRELYTRVNPHTGLAIKDDPTVAMLQVHNEDSMLFWTFAKIPDGAKEKLGRAFADWLEEKYGSLAGAQRAWEGHVDKEDDLADGRVRFFDTYHLTQEWKEGLALRIRDQLQFIGEHQRRFYAEMGRYLREDLGCRQLLNATNWRTANDLKLKEVERWTYAALDFDAENEYYGSDYQHKGENQGYRIDPGHYLVNESCLHKPLELTANFKMQVGHPFIATETSWKHPNLYQSEGPWLIGAYQSLNGLDGVCWFSADAPTWQLDTRRMFWPVGDSHATSKWSCSTPMLVGMFPANALLYRRGYLQQSDPVVHEERSLEQLWNREPPIIDDNEIYGANQRAVEELGATRREDGRVSRAAFLVGRVEMKLGGDPERTRIVDFAPQLDDEQQTIRSLTGQLTWNYGDGLCRMDAPQAQGVVGFLQAAGGRFELSDVTIESGNEYAAVSVVSLDGEPLKSSGKVLIQVGTTARLKGWRTAPAEFDFQKQMIQGERIVHNGTPPWQVAATDVTLTLVNPSLSHATLLDANGYAVAAVEVERRGSTARLRLPSRAMYVVVEQ